MQGACAEDSTLTHGENYLFAAANSPAALVSSETGIFADGIQPLLTKRCVSCHGPHKQKGGLRLDGRMWIERGGKHGPVVVAGDAGGSMLLQRVQLPLPHEDHMPPKEKQQLTPTEIAILVAWINTGASFDAKSNITNAIEKPADPVQTEVVWLGKEIAPAPKDALAKLSKFGATIIPVSRESNYLNVGLTNSKPSDSLLMALAAVRNHVVWLKADCAGWTPAQIKSIARFPNLTKLWLNHSGIGDACLAIIDRGPALQYVNLTGTSVSYTGVLKLLSTRPVNALYLFQTRVTPDEIAELKKRFPLVGIEGMGYSVPTFPSDTLILK